MRRLEDVNLGGVEGKQRAHDWGTSRDGRGASAVRAVVFLRMLTSSDKAGAAGCSWLAAGAGVAGALLKLGSH
jgi:hypothetical protein